MKATSFNDKYVTSAEIEARKRRLRAIRRRRARADRAAGKPANKK